jgi:EAL domain-containing protein (putative c-di-GMP-specific phosphodiesterase class I)/GGDEF domain-containing protein
MKSLLASFSLLMTSFPAFSESRMYSIIEFNIAFVLGLSLPILLLAVLIRKSVPNQWYYFACIMLSVLGFLYSLVHLAQWQEPVLLSFASITLTLIYIWPLSTALSDNESISDNIIEYFHLSVKVIIAVGIIYILSVWFFTELDAYVGWLVSSGFILLCAASFTIIQSRFQGADIYRHVGQWLVTGAFVCTMFFWLNAQVELIWLMASYTLLFLAALINGNWRLVNQIMNALNHKKEHESNGANSSVLQSFANDPSTNLPSYQQALIRFEQLYKQNTTKRYAVVVIKPINFERVNQILGHQNSDILLLQLAYCLQKQAQDNDHLITFDFSNQASRLARLQSLDFLAVIDVSDSHYPEKVLVEDLCRQLSDAVPEAMSFKSFSLNFELACGIAFTGEHGQSVQEVIAHAGDAMLCAENEQELFKYYDAKGSLYTEQQLFKMERLKQDIENNLLHWIVQPLVEQRNKKLSGFSLQVEWRHVGDAYLPLDDFLALAENSGELYTLSKNMVKNAFKLLFELKKINVFQPVSISFPSTELLEPDLVDYIESQIKQYNIAGKYLMIELTEPVMVVACDRAKSMIDQLRMLEVQISIDDFTGSYESLRYIRKLAVDQVTINCNRLAESEDNTAERAIVNSLINLSRTMKLPFVGSHVDTQDILSIYEVMGGNVIQGQTISCGIPINALPDWIEQWSRKYPQH